MIKMGYPTQNATPITLTEMVFGYSFTTSLMILKSCQGIRCMADVASADDDDDVSNKAPVPYDDAVLSFDIIL
jgi:hypothetical protein